MTASFQLHNAEEINLLSSLLLQLKKAGIHIQVIHPDTAAKHQKKINSGITERLYGIVKLPLDFDYKSFLANELLTKHG